ncbi:uncharacterized protein AMSG_05929 [Thecamonas trahens ATCC 50062]|uniref:ABC transporter domain-containing protein n=1 Tax=Thecamonas trahens ATCC 50062 TaxID=461836 RepID=A0A0L0DEB9_THETB|nr:hypothetical protein AMSG_05929 [Thecamonas trahens ATCC 50062]KNC49668.1 hypothetical protein AMSG_05929 [Thecamonas trahens ATCC 50062]|eukprot:XP_013757466.1 hypothetical protein AMSG_05929 [Thecamonas trahens ATCC 50062]
MFVAILVGINSSSGPTTQPGDLSPPTHDLPRLEELCHGRANCVDILYAPVTLATKDLVARVVEGAKVERGVSLVASGVADETALTRALADNPALWGGVSFGVVDKSSFEYVIHTYLYGMRHSQLNSSPPDQSDEAQVAGTLDSGYASLQIALLEAYTSMASGVPLVLNARVQALPSKGSVDPGQGSYFLWPYYWTFCFAYVTIFAAIGYIKEKEDGTRAALTAAGMMDSAYWFAQLSADLAVLIVTALAFVAALYALSIVKHASFGALLVVVLLFGISQVFIALVVSTIVSSRRTASAVLTAALVGSILVYVLGEQFVLSKAEVSWFFKILVLLVPATPFGHFAHLMSRMEEHGAAFSFSAAGLHSSHATSPVSMTTCLEFLALDAALLLLVGLYLDQVLPADHAPRRPLLFFLSPKFWWPGSPIGLLNPPDPLGGSLNSEAASLLASGHEVPVRLRALRKQFRKAGKPFVAVNDVDLSVRASEITTLVSMIMGTLAPSGGDAWLCGVPLAHALSSGVRLGVCAQQDRLYDRLTASEHMALWLAMRPSAVPVGGEPLEAASLLSDVGLDALPNQATGTYSGGQKRKLSLALAFVGNPSIVLLDEPTSGMDPAARRSVWALLQRYKAGRGILLTTHYMDEAEQLGDRIAVMMHGELVVTGTTVHLKAHFGVGYLLTLQQRGSGDGDALRAVVIEHVPGAMAVPRLGSASDLVFRLPTAHIRAFPLLLDKLEALVAQRNSPLAAYGLALSTLEEVFLKVAAQHAAERGANE